MNPLCLIILCSWVANGRAELWDEGCVCVCVFEGNLLGDFPRGLGVAQENMSRFQCCFTPELISQEDSPKETPQVGFTFAGNTHLARLTPQALSTGCLQHRAGKKTLCPGAVGKPSGQTLRVSTTACNLAWTLAPAVPMAQQRCPQD